jgi:PKD repeat protein
MGNQSNAKKLLGIALVTLLAMSLAIVAVDACGNKCKTPTTYYCTCRPSTICGSTPTVTPPTPTTVTTPTPTVTTPTPTPTVTTTSTVQADFVVIDKTPSFNSNAVTLQFNDESTGDPQSWKWDFGDGGTSTDNNPTHTYTDGVDTHTVTLQVSDGNTDSISKEVDTSSQNVSTT